ncbi:hypothetical protein [Clostridium sp.]|uniref:hypothetical protein n=1 Tax=Clostridium sp. TaxID=1506 RepID=UPI003F2BC480
MSLFDLSPEDSLALSAALALALYKCYTPEQALVLADFLVSAGENLAVLLSKAAYLENQNASCKRASLGEDVDIEERVKLLEELLLTF